MIPRSFVLALGLMLAPVSAFAANSDGAAERDPVAVVEGDATLAPPDPEAEGVIAENASMDRDTLAVISTDELAASVVPLTRAELEALAAEALESARLRTAEVVEFRKTNPRTSQTADPSTQLQSAYDKYDQEMLRLVALRGAAFDRLNLVLEEWEEKGGDLDKIEEYRAYRRAVITDTVSGLSIGSTWQAAKTWAVSPSGGGRLLKGLALFFGSLVILFYVARLVRSGVGRSLDHSHSTSHLLQTFIGLLAYWVIVLLGLALIVAAFGFDITPVFAVLGGASFVLAFAMQETLGNFTAGLMIMIYRPFDQGDRIVAAGVEGTVRKLNLTSTIMVTPDHRLVTVPNSKVWNDVIVNTVDLGERRIELEFRIRQPEQALAAAAGLAEILPTIAGVLKQPAPEIYFSQVDGRGATLQVRPWAESRSFMPTRRSVVRTVMEYFAAEQIELWTPQVSAD